MAEGKTYAVIGASRGIGKELVTQLLSRGHRLIATTRGGHHAASLWPDSDGRCEVYDCDILSETSIDVKTTIDLVIQARVMLRPSVRLLLLGWSNPRSSILILLS